MNNYFGGAAVADEHSVYLRRAYLNHLYERVSRLEFSGAELQAEQGGRATFTLDQVYTALLTEEVASAEGVVSEDFNFEGTIVFTEEDDLSTLRQRAGRIRTPRARSAVEQINRHRCLVLLGAPGSGKSSFVNFVTLCLAGELLGDRPAHVARLRAPLPREEKEEEQEQSDAQPWEHGALIPVRIVLRNFVASGLPPAKQRATADDLWRFIESELRESSLGKFAQPLKEELQKHGGLILLDGLDEVPEAEARRSQIKEVVEDFVDAFGLCRFVVTSRTYAYQNEAWMLDGFAARVLAPFNPAQINAFVERWYTRFAAIRDLSLADAEGRALLLKEAIAHNDRLQPLATQPLLLTLMANLHAYRGGSLPERREQLYAAAVELLLDWWERQRVVYEGEQVRVAQPSLLEYLKIGKDRMVAALSELAFSVHRDNPDPAKRAVMRQADVIDALFNASTDSSIRHGQLIEYLSQRAGLLSPEGNRIFSFPHRTFQEYLAARHLTGGSYPDEVAELARTDPGRWREVLLLAGAHAATGTESPIWELVDALCFRPPGAPGYGVADDWGAHLAGQVLSENADLTQIRTRNQPKLERVRQGLVYVLEKSQLPALERAHAGRSLARLGDPRTYVMTVAGMHFCLIPAGAFLRVDAKKQKAEEIGPEEINYDYWMGRFPVSNAQYGEFIAAGGYANREFWAKAIEAGYWDKGKFKGRWDSEARVAPVAVGAPYDLPNHPVVGMTWYEACAFCDWLTGHLRKQHRLANNLIVTLPLEAEWAKAACGGLDTPPHVVQANELLDTWQPIEKRVKPLSGQRYPWGELFNADKANTSESEINSTSVLGCFAGGASGCGVEEMSGTVWEWLLQEPGAIAGGAYYSDSENTTSSARVDFNPSDWFNDFGFRCVVVPSSR